MSWRFFFVKIITTYLGMSSLYGSFQISALYPSNYIPRHSSICV